MAAIQDATLVVQALHLAIALAARRHDSTHESYY